MAAEGSGPSEPAPNTSRQRGLVKERSEAHLAARYATAATATVLARAARVPGEASGSESHRRAMLAGGAATMSEDRGDGWYPLGPATVERGQAATRPQVSGRVNAVAVAGDRVYVATWNGGLWRSLDGGETWQATMEAAPPARGEPSGRGFDENPQIYRADSLACGAVALLPGTGAGSDRLFVGTGDAVDDIQSNYFGVGPVTSVDGGDTWVRERAAAGSPSLDGRGFYEIAAMPAEGSGGADLVFGATRQGLYRRSGDGSWERLTLSPAARSVTSVVAAPVVIDGTGRTVVYAAEGGDKVFRWTSAPAGRWEESRLPGQAGRLALAIKPGSPDIVYALDERGVVYRRDWSGSAGWAVVSGGPGDENWNLLGKFNQAIAVDPVDPTGAGAGRHERIYIGMASVAVDPATGQVTTDVDPSKRVSSGALYRCLVRIPESGAPSMTHDFLGASVHADIHSLVFDDHPAGRRLWVGCDGGVFRSTTAPGEADPSARDRFDPSKPAKLFEALNRGLSTMTLEHVGQHPTDPEILFCGSQDNGCLEYMEPQGLDDQGLPSAGVWTAVHDDDVGATLVGLDRTQSGRDAIQVLASATREKIDKATYEQIRSREIWPRVSPRVRRGAQASDEASLFYPPLASSPDDDRLVAFGGQRVWLHADFGGRSGWTPLGPAGEETLTALAFADSRKLYAGTETGRVVRYVRDSSSASKTEGWTADPPGGKQLGSKYQRSITGIAVDLHYPCGDAVYVTLGGLGDFHRVHHCLFPGGSWESRSGPPPERQFDIPWPGSADLDKGDVPAEVKSRLRVAADARTHPVVERSRWYLHGADGTLYQLRRDGDRLVVSKETHRLLDVHHTAIVVDPDDPSVLYAAADIGIWRGRDHGRSWHHYARGLPDAAVLDLKTFPPPGRPPLPSGVRRLRAATFGRGLYERVTRDADPVPPGSAAGAGWSGRYFNRAELAGRELDGADLSDAVILRSDMARACLRSCNLRRIHISGTSLQFAELAGADLREAILNCDLRGANLNGADLTGARLHASHLGGSTWDGAKLHGADLSRVDPSRTGEPNLRGARYDARTLWPEELTAEKLRQEGAILEPVGG